MTLWVRYAAADGRSGFGTLEGGSILEHRGDLFQGAEPTGARVPRTQVRLLAPCAPGKILGLWNNYHQLAVKLGKTAPTHPLFFFKPPSAVIGPGEPIVRPQGYAGKIVFEGELALVIGRRCKDASAAEAHDAIFGYTCINDVTAAELVNDDPNFPQWCRAKSFDTFACLGPAIATGFEWSRQHVVTRLGETERQNYPLADMIFPPAEQVRRLSADMTLLPGDVIACGTSLGVGSIPEGTTVSVSIEGIGTLSNPLRAG